MTDPLGLIGQGGVHGVNPQQGGVRPGAGNQPAPEGPSFKDVLMKNIEQVNQLQREAETAIEDVSAGRRDDLEGVLLATQKADLAFRTLLSVRNKVQAAYDEIKQMRV